MSSHVGRTNSVTFDAGKEESMILATGDPFGGPIKLLGIDFDSKLSMRVAVHKCAVKANGNRSRLCVAAEFAM